MRYLPILLLACVGCPDTYIDLSMPPAQGTIEIAPPEHADFLTYESGHPISWPYAADAEAVEADWLDAINCERVRRGVAPLAIDTLAVEGARAHSFHMNLHDFMSPTNPEGDGPAARYALMGALYRTVREAVLKTGGVDVSLFGPQLLATDVNHVGVGVWHAREAGLYLVTVDFTWR